MFVIIAIQSYHFVVNSKVSGDGMHGIKTSCFIVLFVCLFVCLLRFNVLLWWFLLFYQSINQTLFLPVTLHVKHREHERNAVTDKPWRHSSNHTYIHTHTHAHTFVEKFCEGN